jgi:uncharacterized membrane-anchored protein YhcB (DUF1043 family)
MLPTLFKARSRDAPAAKTRITADDFKGENVQKAVLSQSLGSPATLFPWAGSAGMVAWSFIAGPTEVSVMAAIGLAVAGAIGFVWNYIINGEHRAAAHVQTLRNQRRQQVHSELDAIAAEAESIGFPEGTKQAKQLTAAYENLVKFLGEQAASLNVDQFSVLAEDTFKQGVAVLAEALDMFKAVQSVDKGKLAQELLKWRRDASRAGEDARSKTLQAQIDQNQRRLDLLRERTAQIEDLLARSDGIQLALQSTYMELVDMEHRDPTELLSNDGGAATRLKGAVDAARRVETKLRGDETPEEKASNEEYLRAASQPIVR